MAAPNPHLPHDDAVRAMADADQLLAELARRPRPSDPPAPAPRPADDQAESDDDRVA